MIDVSRSVEGKAPSALQLLGCSATEQCVVHYIGYKGLAWFDQPQRPENVFKEIIVDAKQKVLEKRKVVSIKPTD